MVDGQVSVETGEGTVKWRVTINGKVVEPSRLRWWNDAMRDTYVLQFELNGEDVYGS